MFYKSLQIKCKLTTRKYYFALLLLFRLCRQIEELKNGFETYAEAFNNIKSSLRKALQDHENMSEIQEALDHVQELIKNKVEEFETESKVEDTES